MTKKEKAKYSGGENRPPRSAAATKVQFKARCGPVEAFGAQTARRRKARRMASELAGTRARCGLVHIDGSGLRGCHGPSTPRAAHKKRAEEKAARSGRDDRSGGDAAFGLGALKRRPYNGGMPP